MRRIFAQTRKELTQTVRDWRTLGLALVLPLVLLLLMSTAISLTVNRLPIVVQDLDGSPASRNFLDAFRASGTFHVHLSRWMNARKKLSFRTRRMRR